MSSLPDCLSFPSFHLCCNCLTRLTTDVNFESLMFPNLLIHSAGEGENLFIPQWTFYPLHLSISHGQLIRARLTSSIMCSVTLTKKRRRNVTILFYCSHSSSSLHLSCCVISITLVNKIQRMAIKAASNGTFPIF